MVGSGADFNIVCSRILLALAAIVAAGSSAHASPWARFDGELLVISKADYFHADLISQDPAGGDYRSLDNNTYLEFGLTENITIGGKAIYGTSWLSRPSETVTNSGFSEIEAFGQYQFLRTIKQAASVKLSAGKPAAFQPNARASLGAGGADIELAALYGRNLIFEPIKLFAAAEVGYRKRIGSAADIVRTQITIGAEPSDHWLFLLEGFSTLSLRNEGFAGADYDIVKIQPSIIYRPSRRWAIQAGVSQDVASRNLSRGRSFFIGLWSAF